MTDPAPRPTDTGLEEASTTRIEKFLAVVLGVFVFIGLVWAYAVPLDRTDTGSSFDNRPAAVVARDDASMAAEQARGRLSNAQAVEVQARETYRTKLDAKQPADAEAAAFAAAQRETKAAEAAVAAATADYERLRPAGDAAERSYQDTFRRESDQRSRDTFLLRLGLVIASLGASSFALDRLRRARSRAVIPAMGTAGAATLLAVVMAADYLDLRSVGPIALSLFGTAVTVAVIVGYQRWLAARLPERRARKQECPWCGYPARHGNPHCEGCGRDVVGDCTTCHQPRRAGVRYCGACGAT